MACSGTEWPQMCTLCDTKLVSQVVVDSHNNGKKHKKNLQDLIKDIEDWQNDDGDFPDECGLCDKRFNSESNARDHFNCKAHKKNMLEQTAAREIFDPATDRTDAKPECCGYPPPRMKSASSMTSLNGSERGEGCYGDRGGRGYRGSGRGENRGVCGDRGGGRGDRGGGRGENRGGRGENRGVSSDRGGGRGDRGGGRGENRGGRGENRGVSGDESRGGHGDRGGGRGDRGGGRGENRGGRGENRGWRGENRGWRGDRRGGHGDRGGGCGDRGGWRGDRGGGCGENRGGRDFQSNRGQYHRGGGRGHSANEALQRGSNGGRSRSDSDGIDEVSCGSDGSTRNRVHSYTSGTDQQHADTSLAGKEASRKSNVKDTCGISQEEMQAIVKDVLKKQKIYSPKDMPLSDMSIIEDQVRAIVLSRVKAAKGASDGNNEGKDSSEEEPYSDDSEASSVNPDASSKSRSARRRQKQRQKLRENIRERSAARGAGGRSGDVHVNIDDNAVFQLVVKKYAGECHVSDLLLDAPHLFPQGFDLLGWLVKSHRFKVFKRRDPCQMNQSLVMVKVLDLRICLNYGKCGRCDLRFCHYLHLCRRFVIDNCTRSNCRFSHNVKDEHNLRVLSDLKLMEIFSSPELLCLVKCCVLQACPRWNKDKQCSMLEDYQLCPQLHICQDMLRHRCFKTAEECKLGHSFDTMGNKLLISAAFYGLSNLTPAMLQQCILFAEDQPSEAERLNETVPAKRVPHKPAQGPGEGVRWKVKPEPPARKLLSSEEGTFSKRKPEPPVKKFEDWKVVHLHGDDQDRYICDANLRKRCRYGPEKCLNHHYDLPYLWQIKLSRVWTNLQSNSNLEVAYSSACRDDYHDFLEYGGEPCKLVCIDFDSMLCAESDSQISFPVRRLTTKSYVEASGEHTYHTKWIWYWLDNDDSWTPYEVDSLPHQDIVEAKYIAKDIACFYEMQQFRYLLDLRRMRQINLQTNKEREVRRRPQMVTVEDMQKGDSHMMKMICHFDKSKLPPSWSPMNTQTFTTPDLILLATDNPQYQQVDRIFFGTMDPAKYEIHRVHRVQNLAMWEKYERKEREMTLYPHLKNDVNKLSLFHGTSSEEVVRCICKQGFDWRVCGKNGTMYGNGSYFAREARYSDNYTNKTESGKQYMFLASVLIGAYARGTPNISRPPQLDTSKAEGDYYNSCVDSMSNPSIYVVFHDDQCYPEYLIEYNKTDTEETLRSGYHSSSSRSTYGQKRQPQPMPRTSTSAPTPTPKSTQGNRCVVM